jgi:glycosyltransferase involved in cell wall biosynthesis
MNLKVSIIIPTFNYGKFLPETIHNLQQQSYQTWEAIIVDDGSTDDTESILLPYLKADRRLLYFKQHNKGVSAARNLGLKYATGSFIQFLDADDLLGEHKLKCQIEYLNQHPDVDICYSENHYFLNGQQDVWFPDIGMRGESWMPKFRGKGSEAVRTLVDNNLAVISNPLFRSEVLKRIPFFDVKTAHTEDWRFWLSCAFSGCSFHYFYHPDAYTLIRVHRSSVSQNLLPMQYGEMRLRVWIDSKLEQTEFIKEETRQIKKLNRNRKMQLFKHVMYVNPIWDKNHLKTMAEVADWATVIRYIFKAINHKKRSSKHDQRSRRHHSIES